MELAVQRASVLQCNVCANQARPQAPLPANTSTATEFNDKIGLDVKYLPGWNPQQKIPCVNVVDYATSFQVMVPIFSRETMHTGNWARQSGTGNGLAASCSAFWTKLVHPLNRNG